MASFVDEAAVHVRGGDGGAGAVSFRREAHVAKGGPDGGDGGRGGDVWLVASTRRASLLGFRDYPHRRAENGVHGQGKRRHGSAGADVVVEVPVGTLVRDNDGELLADLAVEGERLLAAEGGRGGMGNSRFLSNRRRVPTFAEQGEAGEQRWLRLELKLLADVALVGFPNAGKSTLISAVSAARPRIGDYPFTTLEPHLGVVRLHGGDDELVMADIPGLVEGASEGRGLGDRFLRHVERASVLLMMIDLAPSEGRSPADQERILLKELRNYRPELADRPRLMVGSRADLAEDPESFSGLEVSAVTHQGLPEMLSRLFLLVDEAREASRLPPGEPVIHRLTGEGVLVARAPDGSWQVTGREALRAVALSDLNDPGAVEVAQGRLSRLGVERYLRRQGIRDGEVVHVGAFSFTWSEDVPDEPGARSKR